MQTFKTRCKVCKMDFSRTASNGEFSNNLQWGLTLLCLEFASAVYTQEKQVKAAISWSRFGFLSAFHCCKLRCKILANKLQTKGRKSTSSTLFTLQQKHGVIGKNKNCLKVCSKHWIKKWNLMGLFSTFTSHGHLRLIWALQTARHIALKQGYYLAR